MSNEATSRSTSTPTRRSVTSPSKTRTAPLASNSYELPVLNLSRFTIGSSDQDASVEGSSALGAVSFRNDELDIPSHVSGDRLSSGQLPTPSPSPSPPLFNRSFSAAASDFLTTSTESLILRRQPSRPREGGGAKRAPGSPARFVNLNHAILDDLEFSGWGTSTRLHEDHLLEPRAHVAGSFETSESRKFGQWKATGIAGNAVLGSVFYAFPAVVQVAGIYSPIALFIACLILFLFRPIMCELASAFPYNAANYAYLLNASSKTMALVGASLALLDAATTASVSAASFAAYLQGEVQSLPFPAYWITVFALLGFTALCLAGARETVGLAFGILCIHVATMIALMLASTVHWARAGNGVIASNWAYESHTGPAGVSSAIFYGTCLALLGLTGFECAPMSIELIKRGAYPAVLRNMHFAALLLNAPLMLLVFANLETHEILSGANVLSALGERVAGARWFRLVVVIDASVVLCGGILTGFLSVASLLQRLARDRILPSVFKRPIPYTGALHVSLVTAGILSILIYVTTGAQLSIVSGLFSLVFLVDMAVFPVSLLFTKFYRSKLPRDPNLSLEWVILTLLVTMTVIAGNIALSPLTLGYFMAYFTAITLILLLLGNSRTALISILWVLDQSWFFHRFRLAKRFSIAIARRLRRLRRQPVVYFTKTDSISHLISVLRYIQKNESTANVKLCHVYEREADIPSELEANHRIVDEAYPAITVDLLLIQGTFTPALVAGAARKLNVPIALVFIAAPSETLKPSLADWGGVRVIAR